MPSPKAIEGKNYGSIPHLHGSKLGAHDRFVHEGQDRIVRQGGRDRHDLVTVALKLDGTNVGVVKQNGKLVAVQRKGFSCRSSPYPQHHAFDDWVNDHYDEFDRILSEGDRIVGEWLWQASGIIYDITGPPFFAFDFFPAGKPRVTWKELVTLLESKQTTFTVPFWFQYDRTSPIPEIPSLAAVNFPAVQPTDFPSEFHEGWIIRVERKGQFDFITKWVRSDYEPGRYLPRKDREWPTEITLNNLIVPEGRLE